ncbi:tRNA (34-2'-O)-methyltransferase regulator WDR6-like, partial [Amphiura filiformis]|uniref:tRNA (34-2'-O)-methyltransferase regulator WDR6-like n=1 Tax=Amphiura filiformis TaxID=82378 RepID=UPI003B21F0CB
NIESSAAEKHVFQGKVLNVIWASSEDLLASGPGGHLDWYKVTTDSCDTINLIIRSKFILPSARQHWATAVSVLADEGILCGDRRGSLHVYSYDSNTLGGSHSTGQSLQRLPPCHSLFGIHGKTGVTSVCLHDGMIYSTGRDGTYRQHILKRDEEGIAKLQLLNTFKVSKGFQWLERIVFPSDEEMQILGFHTNQFLVWSVTRSERLIEVECGGGHRTWGYTVCDVGSESIATFACVKAQQIFIHRVPWQLGSRQTIVKQALHGNQVTCVKHLASFSSINEEGVEYAVCATGSEDTTVNIVMLYLRRPSNPKILHRLQAHISRVCALAS